MDTRNLFNEFNLGVVALRTLDVLSLFRVLCRDEGNLHLISLGKLNMSTGFFSPKSLSRPIALLHIWDASKVFEHLYTRRLFEVNDISIPNHMSKIVQVVAGEFPDYDRRLGAIHFILTSVGSRVLTDRTARSAAIEEACKKYGINPGSMRTWLFKFFFYGGHPGALLSSAEFHQLKLSSLRFLAKRDSVSGRLIQRMPGGDQKGADQGEQQSGVWGA